MNKSYFAVLALVGTIVALLFFPGLGISGTRLGPPAGPMAPGFGPPMGMPPGGPPPIPFGMMPCPPQRSCTTLSFEGGARGYYSGNTFVLHQDGSAGIDFIRDLNFAQYTLVAEVYGAVRVAPTMALTLSYMIPRIDNGHGILPDNLTVGNTIFLQGTQVAAKSTTSLYRLEGEYFFAVGPQFRAGAYLLGEFWVLDFQMQSAQVRDSQQRDEFLMGAGASGEFSPGSSVFVKFKGACTFLQKQTGLYLDAQGKFFPDMMISYGSQLRPYVAGGYRFRSSEWVINEHRRVNASSQGPYVELGFIF